LQEEHAPSIPPGPPVRNFAWQAPITDAVQQPRRYPIPARLNVVIWTAQVTCSLGCLAAAARVSGWALALCALVFAFVMQTGFSLLHEAEHKKLHQTRAWNDAMGFVCAALFPGSYTFMTVAHLSHHKKNRTDAELVDYVRPHEHPAMKAAQYYLLIGGMIWLGTALTSLAIALVPAGWLERRVERQGATAEYLRFILDAQPRRVRREVIAVIALWVVLWFGLSLTWKAWLVCYAAFGFSWASQQYIYHVRTPRHLIEGAYDLKLFLPLQWLYLCFNFHLQHHRHVNVPWIHLPSLTAPPTRPYLQTYLLLFLPPQPVTEARTVSSAPSRSPVAA
jgi:fatty acid desaturase